MRFSKVVIVLLLLSVAVFTAIMIGLFIKFQSVPDALIAAFFSFCGAEAGVLGWIKRGEK